ncbi:hypothetical protein CROQUDRAFT_87758 [Cronartium quercuum f. sp. fusiforme G11]|uniref:Splicing factor Cactin n=1 Tax=Cronartium quercuum f. sp. fusiforme G11 TaxID=708437 RepID=A0A9P6TFN2_9BASI|nr:hypothetical protein CROQUDRAFT_87758 [Cronartium quercuum f. sp. fusiforme G11]
MPRYEMGTPSTLHYRQSDRDRDQDRDRGRNRERERDRDRDWDRREERDQNRHSSRRDTHNRHRSPEQDVDQRDHRKRGRHDRSRDPESGNSESGDDERRGKKSGGKKSHKKRESSSERRARKNAEKAARKLERKSERRSLRDEEDRRAAAELSVYSATDNPFHDANLSSQFEWGKKRERERKLGLSAEEAARREAIRRAEAKEELERLNIRRAEREKELELREMESNRMAQMAESAQMAEWIAKEDDFQLEQAQKRAEIRVREKRAKPIDLLALNLKWGHRELAADSDDSDEEMAKKRRLEKEKKKSLTALMNEEGEDEDDGAGLEVDLDEPYTIFDNLTLEDTQELAEDIKMHIALEKSASKLEFWRCLLCVCDDALEQLSNERNSALDALRTGAAIRSEITRLLEGKSYEKLMALESSIEIKLAGNDPVDPEYWQSLLGQLKVWKAKAKLKAMHEVVLRNRLEHLRRRQRDEAVKVQAELASSLVPPVRATHPHVSQTETHDLSEDEAADLGQEEPEDFEPDMDPPPITQLEADDHKLELALPADDWLQIIQARQAVLSTRFVPKAKDGSAAKTGEILDRDALAEKLYAQEAEKGLGEEEEMFELEAEMGRQSYNWEDKYRPRKPRYFNKVHTGYEWNKYNQTHYDTDNPPPKVVQGYKFNIFYPDLIDKSRAPTYKIIKNKENEDVATLLFKAGPPYEDIAFTIVNKDWEHSHKRGFRSSFDRGVLQLHFTLKRIHYRK